MSEQIAPRLGDLVQHRTEKHFGIVLETDREYAVKWGNGLEEVLDVVDMVQNVGCVGVNGVRQSFVELVQEYARRPPPGPAAVPLVQLARNLAVALGDKAPVPTEEVVQCLNRMARVVEHFMTNWTPPGEERKPTPSAVPES